MPGADKARRYRERRYAEIALLPRIACACGCGTLIAPISTMLKPARFARGHNVRGIERPELRGRPTWNKGRACPEFTWKRGTKLTAAEIGRRQATRIARNGGVYQIKRGWKHTEATLARMREVNLRKALRGPANPFFGKRRPPELQLRISEQITGARHPFWRGGVGALPYGPGFTRRTKRLILERDQHTCQRCRRTQAEMPRKLQVHHLDHDKQNNAHSNLVTACGRCNIWASHHRDQPFAAAS